MKKYIITTLIGLVALVSAQAQEYKVAKTTGKLIINLGSVTVEGYSGSEIKFTSTREANEEDERAKGLRPINGSGLTDNTGLGIAVTEKNGNVEVEQVTQRGTQVKILVPKGVSISYSYTKAINAGNASFSNIESEIEISVQHNKVTLENITGPLTVKAVYSAVDVKFGTTMKGPISIVSIYGHVDVAIPTSTKADLKMNTSYGEILASPEFKIEMEKTAGDMISYKNNTVKGKLNGGGTDINLVSNYGKIYLRKRD